MLVVSPERDLYRTCNNVPSASSRIVKINNYVETYGTAEQLCDDPLDCVEAEGNGGIY